MWIVREGVSVFVESMGSIALSINAGAPGADGGMLTSLLGYAVTSRSGCTAEWVRAADGEACACFAAMTLSLPDYCRADGVSGLWASIGTV